MAAKPTTPSFVADLGQHWNAWWFQPGDSQPLAAVRIATGLVLFVYMGSWGNAAKWFAAGGLLPVSVTNKVVNDLDRSGPVVRGLEILGDSPTVVLGVQVLLALGALLLAAGCFTRPVAIVTWLLFLWFAQRGTLINGTVEPVLAALLFYLTWSPSGDIWSFDAWRKPVTPPLEGVAKARAELRQAAAIPKASSRGSSLMQGLPARLIVANIALKTLQIHLALLVATMALAKLNAPVWSDGETLWYLTAASQSRPLDLTFLRGFPLVVNAWTHAIVLVEILFPVLVWFPLTRPAILAAATFAWLSLTLFTGDWLFPLAMVTGLLAFVPVSWWNFETWKHPSSRDSVEPSESW